MAPGESSGPPAFLRRPELALIIGIAAAVVSILVGIVFRAPNLPAWMAAVVASAVVSAPFVVAVILTTKLAAAPGYTRRVLFGVRGIDLVWGLAVGLLLRAVVEVLVPTRGALAGGFAEPSPLDIVVLAMSAIVVTPIVEELFFRGVLVAAIADALRGAHRPLAAVLAITASTVLFVALHIPRMGVSSALILLAPLLVSVAAGILLLATRRLAAPIIAHMVFNAIGFALLLW